MSENKHTPEPWHLCEVENETGRIKHLVPVDAEKMSLLTIVENYQATFAAIYNDDDARRIVACVNACAEIDTELLEIIADNDKTLAGVIANIEKQRDELLAALESMVREFDYTCGDKVFLERNRTQALYNARAAIASVKGEQ